MLRFKSNHYFMIDEKELDKEEAIRFIECLEEEKRRHCNSRSLCLSLLARTDLPVLDTLFWFSSYKRHQQDIEMIQSSLDYLRNKWDLQE